MQARRNEVGFMPLSTVYVGGGTPSWLGANGMAKIFSLISENFVLANDAEITVECNPDDVSPAFARALVDLGVNRVSLGVQTFDDRLLRLIGRRHTGAEAQRAVEDLSDAGLHNLSIDMIYGLPDQRLEDWSEDLRRGLSLPIRHLSAYALMYEKGTRLTAMRDAGRFCEVDEDMSLAMFHHLREATRAAGFEHYEISNFALPGFASRHNSAYWDGHAYLGLGPGAHSYDGCACRRSNDADLNAYLSSPAAPPYHVEYLSTAERQDDFVFTALRTVRGLPLSTLAEKFGLGARTTLLAEAAPHLRAGRLILSGDYLQLTEAGIFVSDDVMSDLMVG